MNTDVIDFPPITDAPRADVAVAAPAALDLRKIDLTDVAIAQFGPWRTEVAKLKADNAKTVLDLATQSKIDEARSLRQRTINAPKAEANKIAAALKSKFAATSKKVGAELEAILAGYDEAAANITLQIDAAQKKIDDEREEKARIERERVAALEAKLAGLSVWIERCKAPGMTSERIALGIEALKTAEFVAADWAEFLPRALARKAEVLEVMADMGHAALAREMEAARLEAQRQENERVAAAQKAEAERLAEQQRLLAEQAAELQRKAEALAEQERAAAQARAEKEAADREQAAFDVWADRIRPSGDVTDVHIQWEASEDYADLHGIEYKPLIAAIAAQGEADPAPAVVPAEAAPSWFGPALSLAMACDAGHISETELHRGYAALREGDYIPPSSTVDEPMPQTEAEIKAANGPEVELPAEAESLLPRAYLLAKLAMVMPLFQEARDALTAITEAQRKRRGISATLADRMDVAGTYSIDDWNKTAT